MSSKNCTPVSLRKKRCPPCLDKQKSPLPDSLWRRLFLSVRSFYFVGRWKLIKTRLQNHGIPDAAGLAPARRGFLRRSLEVRGRVMLFLTLVYAADLRCIMLVFFHFVAGLKKLH